MFVLTIDQKGSRSSQDRVPELLALLRPLGMELPFERTVGDEAQAVVSSPDAVVDAALLALRQGGWSVGIGVGTVGLPLPRSSREAGGAAFIAARAAVERAKKTGDRPPIAVSAAPDAGPSAAEAAAHAEAVLVLIARLVCGRSEAEWRILEHVDPHKWGAQSAAARMLGVSSQAVSNAVQRAGWQEEWAARPAAAVLLEWADRAAGSPPR
ncbi:MarR family transcriptional regulator [Arthrobacter sp. BL-252-APC-1A]|uniref:MarR family transcriptional regulator n=1 Tax=Arthrobacter sp. BL-252-APC-1A TaxID=2606622 RepID=UPI0012B3E87D|nr:helix-turn-helix domain-containing protein [Arthrobacter sp. BL-252-APC-1A]MSR98839.1 MarR family transcriptional regulator [Arthrobacter sp. BL-252-APC-1A]